MQRKLGLASVLLVPLALLGSGCWQESYAFPTADDVRMSTSDGVSMRAASLQEYGDVYALGMQSAHEVNGWIGEGIDGAGRVIRTLEDLPPSGTDGPWNIYGPYYDGQTDRSWLIRIEGDTQGSQFEVLVGAGHTKDASTMDELLVGSIEIDDDVRKGTFSMDFDTIEKHELKAGPDKDRTYQGSIDVEFERDLGSELKLVDIIYTDFEVTQDVPIREYFSAQGYSFARDADGAGSFHLDLTSTFQAQVWSGPEREQMTIDLAWNADGAGTGEGRVLELEGEGDLAYGDIILQECFDAQGYFTWRKLNDPYAKAFPAYNSGDPSACVEITSPARGS